VVVNAVYVDVDISSLYGVLEAYGDPSKYRHKVEVTPLNLHLVTVGLKQVPRNSQMLERLTRARSPCSSE
jgi:hypothetical protein